MFVIPICFIVNSKIREWTFKSSIYTLVLCNSSKDQKYISNGEMLRYISSLTIQFFIEKQELTNLLWKWSVVSLENQANHPENCCLCNSFQYGVGWVKNHWLIWQKCTQQHDPHIKYLLKFDSGVGIKHIWKLET